MGEPGNLDELRLDSPPGALSRLRNKTFEDSRNICIATDEAINFIAEGLRRVHHFGNTDELTENLFRLDSPNGARVTYDTSSDENGRFARTVKISLPLPGGREQFDLESFHTDANAREIPEVARITRTVFHGKRVFKEGSEVFGSEENFNADAAGVHKDKLSETRHESVVDPRYILNKLREAFPQF